MGQTAASAESNMVLDLPIAYFEGPKASRLAEMYDGSSALANLTMSQAVLLRPAWRPQIASWLRRGKLHMAATFVGPSLGELLVDLEVADHGQRATLRTTHKSDPLTHVSWDATWLRLGDDGYMLAEAERRTARIQENCRYIDAVLEIREPVEEVALAGVGAVGVRAAISFQGYHDTITGEGKSQGIYLQSVAFPGVVSPLRSPHLL